MVHKSKKKKAKGNKGEATPANFESLALAKADYERAMQALASAKLTVLKWQADSEWALPTFVVPKKDNTVHIVSNFREIDKRG